MNVLRMLACSAAIGGIALAAPVSAQFFFSSHDMSGPPVRGDEPGIGQPLPGATPEEVRANLVWNLRSGLNVAALQCQFEPTLLSVPNYNAMLANHKDELKKSIDTLTKYFARTAKTPKAGQTALDQFGTRTYSGFTTVAAQYGFCQTASRIAEEAAYAPRGHFYDVAVEKMSTLRNALVPWGEQRFPRHPRIQPPSLLPRFDDACWSGKGDWKAKKCGPFPATSQ